MLCLLSTPYCFSSFSTGSFSLDVSPMQKKNIGILFGPTQPTSRQTLGPKLDNGPWAFYLYEIGTQIASPHQRRHLFFLFPETKKQSPEKEHAGEASPAPPPDDDGRRLPPTPTTTPRAPTARPCCARSSARTPTRGHETPRWRIRARRPPPLSLPRPRPRPHRRKGTAG
jgi:hypothetical protein